MAQTVVETALDNAYIPRQPAAGLRPLPAQLCESRLPIIEGDVQPQEGSVTSLPAQRVRLLQE